VLPSRRLTEDKHKIEAIASTEAITIEICVSSTAIPESNKRGLGWVFYLI
jgi:hypothetical protein